MLSACLLSADSIAYANDSKNIQYLSETIHKHASTLDDFHQIEIDLAASIASANRFQLNLRPTAFTSLRTIYATIVDKHHRKANKTRNTHLTTWFATLSAFSIAAQRIVLLISE
jgi:hypothetical protein